VGQARSGADDRAGVFERDTKTDTDRRIALDPHTVQLLAEDRDRVAELWARLKVRLLPSAYVFSLAPDHGVGLLPRYVTLRGASAEERVPLRALLISATAGLLRPPSSWRSLDPGAVSSNSLTGYGPLCRIRCLRG
jgi:hypothetical protein